MTNKTKLLKKISEVIYEINLKLCVIFLLIMVALISARVVGRYVVGRTPAWMAEIAIMSMVWFSMLSIAIGIKDGSHIKMTLVDFIISPKKVRMLKILIYIILIFCAVFMIWFGIGFAEGAINIRYTATRLPRAYVYISIPFAGLTIVITCIERIYNEYLNIMRLESAKKEIEDDIMYKCKLIEDKWVCLKCGEIMDEYHEENRLFCNNCGNVEKDRLERRQL